MKKFLTKCKDVLNKAFEKIKFVFRTIKDYVKLDGLYHFLVTVALCFIFYICGIHYLISALIAFIIGILKETVYDYALKKGTCEYKDVICDFAGSFTFAVIVTIINTIGI